MVVGTQIPFILSTLDKEKENIGEIRIGWLIEAGADN